MPDNVENSARAGSQAGHDSNPEETSQSLQPAHLIDLEQFASDENQVILFNPGHTANLADAGFEKIIQSVLAVDSAGQQQQYGVVSWNDLKNRLSMAEQDREEQLETVIGQVTAEMRNKLNFIVNAPNMVKMAAGNAEAAKSFTDRSQGYLFQLRHAVQFTNKLLGYLQAERLLEGYSSVVSLTKVMQQVESLLPQDE